MDKIPAAIKIFENRALNDKQIAKIKSIKDWASFLYAEISTIEIHATNAAEPARLISISRTSLEESVMWAVKAVSRFQS